RAALQAPVDLHLDQKTHEIPALALLQSVEDALRVRAAAISSRLERLPLKIAIGRGRSKAGGGTLPKSNLPSVTIDIVPRNSSLAELPASLPAADPPAVRYLADDRFQLDVRTIF